VALASLWTGVLGLAWSRGQQAWPRLVAGALTLALLLIIAVDGLRAYQLTLNATNPSLIPQPKQAQLCLITYLLEKSLYELLYELDNRPMWVRIPLAGILSLPH